LMQNLKKSAASTPVELAICFHDDWLWMGCFFCWVYFCRFGWDFHGYRDLRCCRTCSAAAHYRCSFWRLHYHLIHVKAAFDPPQGVKVRAITECVQLLWCDSLSAVEHSSNNGWDA
jgi:hypothetical protein